MTNRFLIPLMILPLLFFMHCATTAPHVTNTNEPDNSSAAQYKTPGDYNVRFLGIDNEITNPEKDRRSYYRIFIDKVEEGRTIIGLESQEKVFEAKLSINNHLLMVEKWVLDEKAEKYVKLNNIDQPKPNYIYFNTREDRIVVITMKTAANGSTDFNIDYEKN